MLRLHRSWSQWENTSFLLALRLACTIALSVITLNLSAQNTYDEDVLNKYLPHLSFSGEALQLRNLGFINETEVDFDVDQAIKDFSTGNFQLIKLDDIQNFGSSDNSYWFAASFANTSKSTEPIYLYFEGINPDNIDLWTIHKDYQSPIPDYRKSGLSIPPKKRDLLVNNSALRLFLDTNSDTILVWRVKNQGPTIFSMYLIKTSDLFLRVQSFAMGIMTLIGGLLSLMLFSVFLFNAVRDRTYLFFIAQLAGFSLYLFSLHGYANMYLWPNSQAFDKLIPSLGILGALLATIQLLRLFLQTREHDKTFNRILLILSISTPLFLGISIINYRIGTFCVLSFILVIILASNITAIRALRRSERGIAVPLIGWAILSLSGTMTVLVNAGLQAPGPAMLIFYRADHWGVFIGSIVYMFALTRRIQYLRRDKEKAEHKNRLKQDFIANISHEMRTPLNGIIGFAESVEHSEHLGEIKFYNKNIISESERLLFQINQLLDLAKIEAGRFDLENRAFSLPQSLAYLHAAYSMKANAKGLDFNLSMDSACPLTLQGDRLRLEQILRNLIDNAVKFTDSGTIGVAVRVYRQDHQQAVLVFDISDTGIGIEQSKLNLIMEDFVQADSSITRRFGGTGLGTSISRRLVEAMDGHIEVKSSEGMGTNFRVFLPFGIVNTLPEESLESTPFLKTLFPINENTEVVQESKIQQAPKKSRILVVDDLDTNRQVLRIHLKALQIDIDEAADAEEALSLLVETSYDLILMDVFMPGMSGHDATRAIRAMPGLATLPIIAVTASGFQQDLDAARDAGMTEVLLKPIKRDTLIELVSRYLTL